MMISTSILNSNDRVQSIIKLNRTNTSYIHIDVMDGNFVKDKQFSTKEINAMNIVSKYPLDVHLMVNDPIKYIDKLENMNIEYITFHLEIKKDIKKIIRKIKNLGYKVGISVKPNTSIEEIIPYLKDIDMVLIMSVEPGLGGQKFMNTTIGRVNKLKNIITENDYKIKIEVDGGINSETITKLTNIDIAVVGSYITKSDNYYSRIENLLNLSNSNINHNKNWLPNFLIISSICLILLSVFVDFRKNDFPSSFLDQSLIYFIGFLCFSIGLFIKIINKKPNNKKKHP